MIEYSYKIIKSLRFAKHRKHYNKFVIEGKRIIQSALEFKLNIGYLYCSEHFIKENSDWIKNNIKNKSIIKKVDKKQSVRISNTKSPSGILTICDIPPKKPLNMNICRWVFIDQITDPGNMGTLIRTCAWFGINNIALSPGCADPYNPKSIRAAMGANFGISLYTNVNLHTFKNSHKIIAADLEGTDVNTYVFPNKCVLVLGNEAHGISNQNRKYIKEYISINKLGIGNSLNVSSAGSILIYLLMNK
tara:strand:- start:6296 stop:7036 length:741 start_codon:yes stop_codon:yes gene_type:complete